MSLGLLFLLLLFSPRFVADILLETSESQLVTYCCFDRMFGGGLCGAKALDLAAALQFPVLVTVQYDGAEDFALAYDQLLRRLLASPSLCVVALTASADTVEVVRTVNEVIEGIRLDIGGQGVWTVLVMDEDSESSRSAARAALQAHLSATAPPLRMSSQELAQLLDTAWAGVSVHPRPLLSSDKRRALFQLEAAYGKLLQLAADALGQMRKRILAGKAIARFPERIRDLLHTVTADFNEQAVGSTAVRERMERLRLLQDFVLTEARRLLEQQLSVLEHGLTKQFRRKLAAACAAKAEDQSAAEAVQAVLTEAMEEHKTLLATLEDADMGLVVITNRVAAFSNKLESLAKEYPDSAEAKLEELRRMERQASAKSRPQQQRRRRGMLSLRGLPLSVSVSLVGFLRPPGHGNLQGSFAFASSLLGLPVDVMLGLQNDGDVAEELAKDDIIQPLLRLQPKLNFALDFQQ